MIEKLGGRKFILSVLSLLTVTALVVSKHISDGVYSAVMLGTVGAYIAGNVAQKLNEKKGA